ncbi:MAG: hypothetical protein KIH63_005680 [Candidatus Saccharibacteria bacterium]|nr:hypothetical protein [Candidatus Saccharibacteria bacterium]
MSKSRSLRELYAKVELIDIAEVSKWAAEDHSMATSLNQYVENRLPTQTLHDIQANLTDIVVLGMYPTHFERTASGLGIAGVQVLHPHPAPVSKRFNYVRPNFFLASNKRTLYVCVPPGKSYLKQYTSILLYFFSSQKLKPTFTLRYYPIAAETLAEWTDLANETFDHNSVCIIGHVDEFEKNIPALASNAKVVADNPYFTRTTINLPNEVKAELVGFKFSFWGDIAFRVAFQLYKGGCNEVIYFGKVGALERHIDLYKTIIIPESFMIIEHDRVIEESFSVPNGLADFVKSHTHHVSTPTVMEQGYVQRNRLEQFRPQTIDNEIAYIALATRRFNEMQASRRPPVRFSSISFATDYLRRPHEHMAPSIFDLSNNRSAEALRMKAKAMSRASRTLYDYLTSR